MHSHPDFHASFTFRNDLGLPSRPQAGLTEWIEAYFQFEVVAAESSQKVQRRDLTVFLDFFVRETGGVRMDLWSPRVSRKFLDELRGALNASGTRRWNDRSANRIVAHLKTFAKWAHRRRPFPLGDPMLKIKAAPKASGSLDIQRAFTEKERERLLDASDLLTAVPTLPRSRKRSSGPLGAVRKQSRPWRDRAIVYTLIETGMRRAAVSRIDTADLEWSRARIRAIEKGGREHFYKISREGMQAIQDYLERERAKDAELYRCSSLFLPAFGTQNKTGRLHPNAINSIWNSVCRLAGCPGYTPHSARHAMGRYLIKKTGNVEAVQRQLGHKNAAYSLQYARITEEELERALEGRQ